MSTETLIFTETRIFQESAIGTGTATGNVLAMPLVSAAAKHNHQAIEGSMDAFRHPSEKLPIHTSYQLRTSHVVNPAFAGWLIEQHLVSGKLRRLEAPKPSFAMQYELEDGDLVEFRGVHLTELQISGTESRTVTMECSWVASERNTAAGALEALSGTLGLTRHVSSLESAAAIQTAALDGADPRTVNGIPIHAFEFIMARDVTPALFSPFGNAQRMLQGPWAATGEIRLPASALTESGFDINSGACGIWIGPDGSDLALESSAVTSRTINEPLQGEGFREHSLALQYRAAADGTLLTLINNT